MIGRRRALIRGAIAIIVLLSVGIVVPVYAKDHAARLRECLQTDYMYLSISIKSLNDGLKSDREEFKEAYHNHFVVLSGDLKVDSVSNNKKEINVSDSEGNKCIVDTSASDAKAAAEKLNKNDKVTVYGKISVTGFRSDSYKLVANKVIAGDKKFTEGSYVFDADEEYNGVLVDSLTSAKKAKYFIPQTWDNNFVRAELTNNGVNGFQYYLNAISPQYLDYPEIFSIFYFDNETYLEQVPVNPTDGDNKDIEKEIVKNIIRDLEGTSRVKIETFKDINGNKIDYYSTTYRPKDGNDYRLEFMFKPGKKGIICMLYLYFPKEEAVNHLREAAYLVGTATLEE